MRINEVIPALIKVSDKLSTTKDFEVVAHLDSIIKKMAQATKQNVDTTIEESNLKFASDVEIPMVRDAAAVTLIRVADALDKVNPELANRVDASIKLLAQRKCVCLQRKRECSKCEQARSGVFGARHCSECGC